MTKKGHLVFLIKNYIDFAISRIDKQVFQFLVVEMSPKLLSIKLLVNLDWL